MSSLPAIVLAFANDWAVEHRHLRNLLEEGKSIGKALAPLVEGGRIAAPAIHNATAADVIDTFGSAHHRDRIRVFHFAGHASSATLLFEDGAGLPAAVSAASLADFLGCQRGLALVFLNGCCTEPQVRRLRDAGVRAVVATTSAIRDDVAAEFAAMFYAELAARSLRDAFATAEAAVRMRRGDDPRAVLRDVVDDDGLTEPTWPWIIDCDPDHAAWRLGAELVDDVLATGTVPLPERAPPSALLVARHTVVPWRDHGRTQLLAELDAWADDPGRDVAVRLLHGPGGAGKTRLAIEWVARRRAHHHVAGFLVPRPGERWLDRLCRIGAPVLIVIDYAESRADLVELLDRLADSAVWPGAHPRVRVLLLARGDGDWWTELGKRTDAIGTLLSQSEPIALPALATTAPDRDAVFAETARVFARVRGKPTVPPPILLDDAHFERALYLHMAALAAVEGISFDAGTLMDAMLDHEQRFWRSEAATLHQSSVDESLARQLVAAATLRGGVPDEDAAQDLCVRLARRTRTRDDDALIRLLHHVYGRARPSSDAPGLVPPHLPNLEPDLLGEAMVVRVAKARLPAGALDPDLRDSWIGRVFIAGDDEQALTTGFTVLGRASATDGAPVRPWIASLLETDLATRAILALRAAKIVTQRTALSLLGDALAKALEQHGSVALASALDHEGIPYPTVCLLRVASWRSQVLLDGANIGTDETSMAQRAARLAQHGVDLAAAGQREMALTATHEAVELYRALAARNPDAFQPDLAGSLNNLGNRLSSLGQREAAFAATHEAVELHRALAARNPDAFRPDLAMSLNNVGLTLGNLGQREAAFAATREAVELHRALAAHNPDAFQADLAMSLNNLSIDLSNLGQWEAAFAATHEAVELYRVLAARNPDAFQPDLATSLNNLGNRLRNLGQREAALAAIREAVELRRTLALRNPDAFQPALAMSLNNLGNGLTDLGQREAALAATREAVELRRVLAARNPDAFQPALAGSLNNLGNRLSNMGQREAALAATGEAVELRRTLAARNPDAFQPDLASSLNNLGLMLSNLGQHEAALAATREAVELYRTLVVRNPDAFQPDLAGSLNNLGLTLSNLEQREAALAVTRESVDLRRALAARNPDAFQPGLASSLNNLAATLNKLGQHEAALAVTREAVELHRTLEARNPDAFQPDLASSLNNLGNQLSDLGQHEAALAVTREGVELRRVQVARNPDAFQPDLARSLNNLGLTLSNLGQHEAALAATHEAVELRRALAARNPEAFQPDLASGLNNLGLTLSNVGQHEAALAATREAVELRRTLAARNPDAFQPDLASSVNNLRLMLSNMGQHEAALAATREAEQLRSMARSASSSADNTATPGGALPT